MEWRGGELKKRRVGGLGQRGKEKNAVPDAAKREVNHI